MLKKILIALACSISCITSYAVSVNSNLFAAQDEKELGTLSITGTPDAKTPEPEVKIQKAINYYGSSTTNPCSDLKPTISEGEDLSVPIQTIILNADKVKEASLEAGGPGYEMTCMQINFIKDGRTFSSGNIVFKWENKEPILMAPSNVSINFP